MCKSLIFGSLLVGGLLLIGCGKDEATPVTPATPATPAAPQAATPDATPATPAAPPAVPTMPAVPKVDTSKVDGAVSAAKDQAGAATGDVAAQSEASDLMKQVTDAMKNAKLDDADAALKKLEAMKSKLPQSMQDQIAALRTQFDAAKAGLGGAKLPDTSKLPGLPK